MFIQILIAILIGTLFGTITGLIPGIHINLLALLILTFSPLALKFFPPEIIAVVIVAMAINHTFLDTIPSIFLGAPDADTALSVLPGHKMLLQGEGYSAIMLTVMGSLSAIIISISLVPLIIPAVKFIYPIVELYIAHILIFATLFLILKEPRSKLWALIIFLMAGTLGIASLNIPTIRNPLFPLLSGLFGTSMLVLSIKENTIIPKQNFNFPNIEKSKAYQAVGASFIAGGCCSFLPGLGPSQAAIIGQQITKNLGDKGFLILIGALNTVNMVLSFVALHTLNTARNGAIVIITSILKTFTINHLILFLGAALVVAGIATILAIYISKAFSKIIPKVNYKMLCALIILLIVILVSILSGPLGLLVLVVSTFVGMIPQIKSVGKNHLMGCLILPVILYFII